ncbi:MAG TPA: hypothetical protein VFA67_15605 [Candidatus Sulfotelmatobacter sp.]|nr:hypothetical protein [Candidatus Sulfotelmatobacter sp.]
MGFRRTAVLLQIVLLCVSLGWAAEEQGGPSEITVMVQNRAKLRKELLKDAETEAARIFRAAHVTVHWLDCSRHEACHHIPGINEFVLNIVPDGRTSSDLVYGLTFLGPAGEGKYSDVFFRRIDAACAQGGCNVARFLGTVAAHELGHLLLGSHAHTYEGIMAAVWKQPVLRRMEMGSLLFTPEQSAAMRARLTGEDAARQLPAYTLMRTRSWIP